MSDEKKKISVIVPVSLLDRLRQQTDCNITEATIKGLELLVNGATNNIESDQNIIQEYLKEIEVLKLENTGFKARSEELQAHNETLNKRIESLEDQLHKKDEQLHMQAVHLQTLINQKALEAPGTKKPWWQFW